MANWQPVKITKDVSPGGGRRVLVDYANDAGEHFQQSIAVTPDTTDATIEDSIAFQLDWFTQRDDAFDRLSEGVLTGESLAVKIAVRPAPIKPPVVELPADQAFWQAYRQLQQAQGLVDCGIVKADDPVISALREQSLALFSWSLLG